MKRSRFSEEQIIGILKEHVLSAAEAETAELRAALATNNLKLAEAQKQQADLMRQQRLLDEEKRELDLTIEKRVQASVADIQLKAKQEADESARLRVAEIRPGASTTIELVGESP